MIPNTTGTVTIAKILSDVGIKSVLNIIVLWSANTTKKYSFTINGIEINEKNDVNAVNDMDKATFPPNFLVI